MLADVAQLNLVEPELIDFDKYQDGGNTSYAPPPEGRYFGKAPIITDESFGATKEGLLKLSLDPIEIVNDAKHSGYKVRFTSLSVKKYKNREGNQMMDFLRACGLNLRPKNNQEYIAALKQASGRTFQFALIWEAYNKDTEERTSGYDNFPPDPQNPDQKLPYIVDQYDPTKRWWANGKVRYFVSAVSTS